MRRARVEILYFEGCPNHGPTRALVERVATGLGMQPEIELVEVGLLVSQLTFEPEHAEVVTGDDIEIEPGLKPEIDRAAFAKVRWAYRC